MTTVQAIPFANARLRIKRDVLFTETAEGVLFHNAHGGFHLTGRAAYRFATLIVPFLDGEHSVAQLCEMLPAQQQQMVSSLARMLLERGLARDVEEPDPRHADLLDPAVAERFAEQINYIDHYEDRALVRFHRFRTASVAVLGDDEIAGWVAVSAIRNGSAAVSVRGGGNVLAQAAKEAAELAEGGCPAEVTLLPDTGGLLDWSDLTGFELVVCTGSQAPAQTLRLLTLGVPEGQRLLPLTRYGNRVIVGPLSAAGAPGCWSCAMLRLGHNGDSAAAAEVWRAAATGGDHTGARPGRHLSAMLGNLLGFEMFREFSGVLPPETEGGVIVQEIDSFDSAATRIAPHPLCRCCAPRLITPEQPDWTRIRLGTPVDSAVPEADAEGLHPSVAELDELSAALVHQATGVFKAFDDDWPTQLPLKVSRLEFGAGTGDRRTVTTFDLHNVAAARMRALRRAATEYVELVTPAPAVAPDTGNALDPAALLTFGAVPSGRFDTGWTEVRSLLGSVPALVPVAAVRPRSSANTSRAFVPTSAGLGAGTSLADAAYRGLFSALTYRALQEAMHADAPRPLLRAGDLPADDELTFLLRCADTLGAEVELLNLDPDGPATVLLARTGAGETGPLWATGADLDPVRAAKIALRDLLGQRQILLERPEATDFGHRLLESFDPYTVRAGEPGAAPAPAAGVPAVLEALRAAGCEAYALAEDSADLRDSGLRVVRVLLARTGRS